MYSLLTSKETKTFSWAPGELWFPGTVAIVPDGKDGPFCMGIPGNRMTDSVRICSDLKAGRSTYLAVVLFFFFNPPGAAPIGENAGVGVGGRWAGCPCPLHPGQCNHLGNT